MSALPPEADIRRLSWDVRYVSKADIAYGIHANKKPRDIVPGASYRNGAADDQAVAGRRRMDCVQAIQNGLQASIFG
jgi:hypothetical protein